MEAGNHMKWKNLQMPRKVELDPENSNDRYGRFVVEPLERGFGITLGNSIRRVLLSSLQGAAVTAVRFDGVLHEFSTLPGVIEDATEIILNLKQMRFKLHGDGPKKGLFEAREKGELRAGDLQIDSDVEVLNPDLHIATLNTEGDLRMEIEIDAGRGYVAADQHEETERPIGVIPVDSVFSPVLKVNYKVEQARIGQRIDYDKLQVDVWTDGSILPSGRARGLGKDPSRSLQHVHPLRGADRGGAAGRGRRRGHQDAREARPFGRRARALGAIVELLAAGRDPHDRRPRPEDRVRDAQVPEPSVASL